MSLLMDVSASVQQVAEAISIAIGVEVEIVDDELTLVGGTGLYRDNIGEKEESGRVDGDALYARMLRSGTTEFIADTKNYQNYNSSFASDKDKELAEVCTPILLNGSVVGVIGLIAVREEQRRILVDKAKGMAAFVEKMADLLAAKAEQRALLNDTESAINQMTTVLEATHEGIFDIDRNGYVKHCNDTAAKLFSALREDIVGSHISKYMLSSPALAVLKTGAGYTEREEVYKTYKGTYHFIVSAKPYYSGAEIKGAVISFRDIEEAEKLAYNINAGTLKYTFDDIIGESEAVRHAKNQALLTARGNSTVLITGESGTGKEMFAKAIHYSGSRSSAPFVTVNCGAIPENLLESELFGYERGAFTGASDKGKMGKFEMASGGTIFLDEIGDMPLHLQVKMLHVLQDMRFERVGGNKTVIVDVRVIAATNRDLEEMIRHGSFREDLYYRLSVIPLTTPPLRGRREDIRLLAGHFLKKYNAFMNKRLAGFTEEAEAVYEGYDWPGNVRELENAVEYGVNMAFGDRIGIDAIPARLLRGETSLSAHPEDSGRPLSEQLKTYEKEIILQKLKQYGNGRKAKDVVAKELGLSRATLYRKLTELDIANQSSLL
ncbi:MAG: sigma 54-interacting transcriptional regulator [Clostridiales Family XIII bacterium]|jgi:transcriptional regulator with PAS, ATPase and Fis domain|nr:sigma 54-interacting transcriptional regulator [Clostridiales Family XIII bacterium]